MRKIILIILIFSLFFVVGCVKNDKNMNNNEKSPCEWTTQELKKSCGQGGISCENVCVLTINKKGNFLIEIYFNGYDNSKNPIHTTEDFVLNKEDSLIKKEYSFNGEQAYSCGAKICEKDLES